MFPGILGGVTSLIGGLIGAGGAKSAATTIANKAQQVGQSIDRQTGLAIGSGQDAITQSNAAVNAGTGAATQDINAAGGVQRQVYSDMAAGYQPYQSAGTYGLNQLQANAGTFNFDPNDVTKNPAYQFQLAQGTAALQKSAALKGGLQSGGTLKALDQYSQGLASTSEQNLYNQALSTYNTNMGGYQSLANLGQNANSQSIQAGSTYGGQLTSLANLGANTQMQGAGMLSNTAMQGNEYIGNVGMQGVENAGQVYMTGAGATAAGQVGQANAWSNALGQIGGGLMSGSSLMAGGGGAPQVGYYGSGGWTPAPTYGTYAGSGG
jgi:hypothetical protein